MNPPTVPTLPTTPPPPPKPMVANVVSEIVMGEPSNASKKNNKKTYIALAIIALLATGTISGLLLIMRPVLYKSQAWSCGQYAFALSSAGVVTATNGSDVDEPVQRAEVYINNTLVTTLDVPALSKGARADIGTVTLPTTTFTWQIKGTADCSNEGRVDLSSVSYQCRLIKAFNTAGTEISATTLTTLSAGDVVRFVVNGSGVASDYSAAQFTINATELPESTLKTTAGDYYTEYTIPANTKTFTVSAKLKAKDGNWY